MNSRHGTKIEMKQSNCCIYNRTATKETKQLVRVLRTEQVSYKNLLLQTTLSIVREKMILKQFKIFVTYR